MGFVWDKKQHNWDWEEEKPRNKWIGFVGDNPRFLLGTEDTMGIVGDNQKFLLGARGSLGIVDDSPKFLLGGEPSDLLGGIVGDSPKFLLGESKPLGFVGDDPIDGKGLTFII